MALDRTTLLPAAVVLLLGAGGVVGYLVWQDAEDRARAERRREAREREAADDHEEAVLREARLGEESRSLIPEMLAGVELGMSIDQLRAARPAARAPARPPNDPAKLFLEEQLQNGANVMYGFERRSRRLLQVQILSRMPAVEAIAPHLTAMNERYGSPTGIWDCPDTEGLPTRRFTWRRAFTTVSDVFLVHPGGVSVTLYIAPSEVIERSLRMSSCRPVRSREELETFPVATAEQIQAQRR